MNRRAPSFSARSLSLADGDAVSTTTGMSRRDGDCRISCNTPHPSTLGMLRSRRTRLGVRATLYCPCFCKNDNACSPIGDRIHVHRNLRFFERISNETCGRIFVLNVKQCATVHRRLSKCITSCGFAIRLLLSLGESQPPTSKNRTYVSNRAPCRGCLVIEIQPDLIPCYPARQCAPARPR
jgi:hypothetical protein